MSTKTIKQRIAVVAVSALAAGFLSIASTPVANASPANGDFTATTGTIGLVGALTPTIAAMPDGSTTRTAVLMKTGKLVLVVAGDSTVKVSSGALVDTSSDIPNISGDQTCAADLAATNTVTIKPTGAAGSTFTVTSYAETTCATAATINEVLTVTIAGENLAGVADPANSTVRWTSSNSAVPTAADDVTYSSTDYANTLELYINVADAYEQDLATGGALVITASSGAYLGTPNTSGASAGTGVQSTQVFTSAPAGVFVVLRQATAGAGWNGTVTVSFNGKTIATKAGKITGAPATISAQPYKIGRTGTSAASDTFLYTVKDLAGNGLDFTSSDIALDSTSNAAVVSGIATGDVNASSSSAYGAHVGSGKYICAGTSSGVAGGGTSSLVLKYTLSNGSVIKSNAFTATCGGAAYNYTASLDKASYVQGEVATLTVTFKDAKGSLADSMTSVAAADSTGGASTNNVTLSTPMLSQVGSVGAHASVKPGLAGTLVYKFSVGTSTGLTAGSYNATVSFPSLTLADPVTVGYKVTTGASTTTNEDVLKSIVALIASINKQIQALQKLILRR